MNAPLGVMAALLGFMSIGPMELMVIAGLGVLIFGHRLPKVARGLGRGIIEFKKGLGNVRDQVDVREDIGSLDAEQADEPVEEQSDAEERPSRRSRGSGPRHRRTARKQQ